MPNRNNHTNSNLPVVPFTIRDSVSSLNVDLLSRLECIKIDRLAAYVGRMYVMSSIKSLYRPAERIFGNVSTVKCPPGDNLAVFKALTLINPGDILVIDAQGFQEWCLGGFEMLLDAKERFGLAGLIVNGAYRDIEEAQAARFPLYGLGVSLFSGPKSGPGEINVPVCCGGVVVHPGDVVSGCSEGIVVVPRDSVEAIVSVSELEKPVRERKFDWDSFTDEVNYKISSFNIK